MLVSQSAHTYFFIILLPMKALFGLEMLTCRYEEQNVSKM